MKRCFHLENLLRGTYGKMGEKNSQMGPQLHNCEIEVGLCGRFCWNILYMKCPDSSNCCKKCIKIIFSKTLNFALISNPIILNIILFHESVNIFNIYHACIINI